MTTTVNASGGTVSVHVGAAAECVWHAEVPSTVPWIAVESPTQRVGPGSVVVTLEPNRSFESRVGAVLIRDTIGHLWPVSGVKQRGAGCLYAISPTTLAIGRFGTWDGSGDTPLRLSVTAEPADCQWTTTASAPWIRVLSSSTAGIGSREISVNISPNLEDQAPPRSGTVTIAGLSGVNPDAVLTISQSGR
jgi:hypothetical protein